MAGCDYAMHLDMNPYHTGFLFAAIDDFAGKKYKSQLLTAGMSIPTDRYIQYSPKDFFYVLVHDPTPPGVDGGTAWEPDGGSQPPPRWMPGIWTAHADVRRAAWSCSTSSRVARRGGCAPAPTNRPPRRRCASSPGTTPGTSCSLPAQASPSRRARAASPPTVASPSPSTGAPARARSSSSADGELSFSRAHATCPRPSRRTPISPSFPSSCGTARPRRRPPPTRRRARPSASRPRAASSWRAGRSPATPRWLPRSCGRAARARLSLDRGAEATAFVDRAGSASPPRGRYDETVLFAIAAPMKPRGFRFDASTLYVASKR